MSVKVFSTGEVLTASDTNTYLANSGLVYIKSQTVGSGVGSVTVADAFSATYDNYRIVYSGGASSLFQDAAIYLGGTMPANGYYASYVYADYSSASALNAGTANGQYIRYVGISNSSTVMSIAIDINSPFQSKITTIAADHLYAAAAGYAGRTNGFYNATTSFTSFTLLPASGTYTGGTITVYGYRKA